MNVLKYILGQKVGVLKYTRLLHGHKIKMSIRNLNETITTLKKCTARAWLSQYKSHMSVQNVKGLRPLY